VDGRVLTEHSVADAARSAGFDPALVRFVPTTGSTNTDLMELEAVGRVPAWTVLVAGHQVLGRGRLGRVWEAPPGSALLVSVAVPAPGDVSAAPLVSFAAAVAIVDALQDACGVAARCKWPNDVLVGERKIAGILAEARSMDGRVRTVVVGAGVNVLQTVGELPPGARVAPTSVAAEGGTADLQRLLASYLTRLRGLVDSHRRKRLGLATGTAIVTTTETVTATILEAYRERCSTLGRRVRATIGAGREVVGTAIAVEPTGELVVRTDQETVRVAFGEVVHLT
jgi:BirA family transcriptional regulator, biotin operon repressor / biotin---[acetyl-CoA-carboxylase] ligase